MTGDQFYTYCVGLLQQIKDTYPCSTSFQRQANEAIKEAKKTYANVANTDKTRADNVMLWMIEEFHKYADYYFPDVEFKFEKI